MRKIIVLVFIPAFIICTGLFAFGGTGSAPMIVSATMVPGCTVSANPLPFGEITPYRGSLVTTTIIAECTDLTNYSISIDAGMHKTSGGLRAMQNIYDTTKLIPYTIWWDTLLGSEPGDPGFGDTFPTGSLKTGIGNGNGQTYTIVGQAPALNMPIGEYQDMLVVAVNF